METEILDEAIEQGRRLAATFECPVTILGVQSHRNYGDYEFRFIPLFKGQRDEWEALYATYRLMTIYPSGRMVA